MSTLSILPKSSGLDPVVVSVLETLLNRELAVGKQGDSLRTATEFLMLDNIFSNNTSAYKNYTECFLYRVVQGREPDYYPAGQNYSSGNIHFSTVQAIITNGAHIADCEAYLYTNTLIAQGQYIYCIDIGTKNTPTRTIVFQNATIRAIYTYSKYVVLEFQYMTIASQHDVYDNANMSIGQKSSSFILDQAATSNPVGGGGGGNDGGGGGTDTGT